VLTEDELAKIGRVAPKRQRLVIDSLDKEPRRVVGAGWDPLQIKGVDVDIDVVTLMLTRDPEAGSNDSGWYVASRDRLVHYHPADRTRKVSDASGAVEYQGDSRDGTESDELEDETVIFDFSKMPADVGALMTFVNIHKQDDYPPFINELTFDQVQRAFASSFPEGLQNVPEKKRVTGLSQKFAGSDTVVIKFDWRTPDGTWQEEFVEQYVPHLPQYQGKANAGFLSAIEPYL
jgi:stress response protein SCP2